MESGLVQRLPYSFSRWTDVSADPRKWAWFLTRLKEGVFLGVDPRTAVPREWSLKPEDTLELTFWTKDPIRILKSKDLLKPYRVHVHVTVTGWHEVERGVPWAEDVLPDLKPLVETFGPANVTWRVSPIPMVADLESRFAHLASLAKGSGIERIFASFLQENDLLPDTRTLEEKKVRWSNLLRVAQEAGLPEPLLCDDDRAVGKTGICTPPSEGTPLDTCGCPMAVDAFGQNEACLFACGYCYAANKGTAPKRRNSTRSLNVL